MKLIFVSGPSGSGKTTLANQIILKIRNGIILNTDNYYQTGLISKLLSKIIEGYFDRNISFNYKLFKKDFNFILKKRVSMYERSYSFKNKTIKTFLNEIKNIKFLIVEGIFAKEFSSTIYNQKFYLLELKNSKKECMRRVIQRDINERGKKEKKAEIDFLKSWDIYYEKFKNKSTNKNMSEIIITKKTNLDQILKKIFN